MKIEMAVNKEAKATFPIKAARDKEWIWHLENPGSVTNEYIAAHVRAAIHAAVAEAVAGEREAIVVLLQEILAEGIHIAFRRGGDGSDSTHIWEMITKMDDAEWGGVVSWLAGGLEKVIRSRGEGEGDTALS